MSLKLTVLQPSTGRHDQREVPWKDPIQTDEDADQRHGGMQLCAVFCCDKLLESVKSVDWLKRARKVYFSLKIFV